MNPADRRRRGSHVRLSHAHQHNGDSITSRRPGTQSPAFNAVALVG